MSSNMHKMRRFRSFCVCTKYHPGFCSTFIHLKYLMIQLPDIEGPYHCADAQVDLGLRCRHIPEDMFSHGHLFCFFVVVFFFIYNFNK